MKTRIFAAASVSALAVGTLVAPAAIAQVATPSSSAAPTTSAAPAAGSLDSGSLSGEGGSLKGVVPTSATDSECKLPNLGGSIAKVFPLFGISGIPSVVINLATGALDSFPNALEVLGLDGQVSQLGSLEGPMCSTVFGGYMTSKTTPTTPAAPVTVTVVNDAEGNPVTTITPTPSSSPAASSSVAPTTTTANGSLGGLNFGS